MTHEERVKMAALEFAQAHPIQWDDYLEKWLAAHPVEETLLKTEGVYAEVIEQTVKTQDIKQEEPSHARSRRKSSE